MAEVVGSIPIGSTFPFMAALTSAPSWDHQPRSHATPRDANRTHLCGAARLGTVGARRLRLTDEAGGFTVGRGNRVVVGVVVALVVAGVGVQGVPARERPGRDVPDRFRTSIKDGERSGAPEVTNNFEVVGHARLGHKTKADVYLFDHGGNRGLHAYVGSASSPCNGRGVHIVDVTNPEDPRRVARARKKDDAVSYEDPVVIPVGNRDVLGVGVQQCGRGGRGGLALFDVTNPARPKKLSFLRTKSFGVHEMDMVVRADGVALAALAVPFGEVSGGNDMVIVDVSKPRRPTRVTGWGVIDDSSLPIPSTTDPRMELPEISTCCQGIGTIADFFFHSVRFADDGATVYASHWDAGILKFDLEDPANPVLVGRTLYPFDADGDGHSMTPYEVGGKRYILQNDEDFERLSPAHIRTSATGATEYAAPEIIGLPSLLTRKGTIEGELADAGDGCQASDFAGADGKIVFYDVPLQNRTCRIVRQFVLAARAGAQAVLVNVVGEDRPFGFLPVGGKGLRKIRREAKGIPGVVVSSIDGLAETLRMSADPEITVTLEPQTPSWGFLRIYDESAGTDTDGDGIVEWEQVAQFADLPNVQEFPGERGFWSIHNTEVFGDRAYSSWYSHGIVALDVSDPLAPTFVGQFVPRTPKGEIAEMWGVAIDSGTGLIYGSDIGSGLWILRPTGVAAPTP
jgi:hypothetical protein